MNWLRFVVLVIFTSAMSLLGALLAIQNPQVVPLDLLFITFRPRSIALWILSALVFGALLGMFLSGLLALRLKARLVRTRRKLEATQLEVDQLRRSGLISSD